MISRIIAALAAVICSGLIAYAQFQSGLSGIGEPGGKNALVQFNTNGVFGGITGLTSDGVGVSFGTSSQLILYGFTVGNCLKVGASNQVADSGGACGGGPGTSTSIVAGSNITTSGTATDVTVNVVATPSFSTVIASGNLTAGTAQFTGAVSGTTAVFQTITDGALGGCLQATAGVIGSTGVNCATQVSTPSIAAGTNITTSGTAANTTINAVPSGSAGAIQYTNGSNFVGDAGLLDGGGGQLTYTLGTITTPGRAIDIRATWNSAGASFDAPLFMNITTSGFAPGSNLIDLQASGISQFEVTPTGTLYLNHGLYATGVASNGSIHLATPSIVQMGDGGDNANGYYNWAGEGRLTADAIGFVSTGFRDLIALQVKAGRTYKLEAQVPIKSAAAATGGIAFRIGGGASATAIVYHGWIIDSGFNGNKGSAQSAVLSGTVAAATVSGTTGHVSIFGTITVNVGGSVILQAAGFTTVTAASAVTVERGTTFLATDIP